MTRDREEIPGAGPRGHHRVPAERRESTGPDWLGPVRRPPQPVGVTTIRQLQRAAGNAAVGRTITMVQRKNGKFSEHAAERGKERGISNTRMREVMRTGSKYDDPAHEDSIVYYEASTGWTVCTIGGKVTTTYQTPRPKSRWVPR